MTQDLTQANYKEEAIKELSGDIFFDKIAGYTCIGAGIFTIGHGIYLGDYLQSVIGAGITSIGINSLRRARNRQTIKYTINEMIEKSRELKELGGELEAKIDNSRNE